MIVNVLSFTRSLRFSLIWVNSSCDAMSSSCRCAKFFLRGCELFVFFQQICLQQQLYFKILRILDGTFIDRIAPVGRHRANAGRQHAMENERCQVHVAHLGKIYLFISRRIEDMQRSRGEPLRSRSTVFAVSSFDR